MYEKNGKNLSRQETLLIRKHFKDLVKILNLFFKPVMRLGEIFKFASFNLTEKQLVYGRHGLAAYVCMYVV